jgi:methionyl-tRNA formyltransferase
VPSLEALLQSDIELSLVVTNPDKPAGRKLELQAPPVKRAATEAGLEVLQPDKARDPSLHDRLHQADADAATVVAYGKLLPPSLLEIPRLGFVNLHFSLLPAYRGAAPVQRALMDGVETTGATIIVLTEGMDEGPIIATATEPVQPDDTAGTLGAKLAVTGAALLVDALRRYVAGELDPVEQDHDKATFAPKITHEEAHISWDMPAVSIRNLVRALNPEPGAWTIFRNKRMKVLGAAVREDVSAVPGVLASEGGLIVGTATDALELTEVQLAGKRAMTGVELARGLRGAPGETFE